MGEIFMVIVIFVLVSISFLKINSNSTNSSLINPVKANYEAMANDERPMVLANKVSSSEPTAVPSFTPFPSSTPIPDISPVVADNTKKIKNFWAKDFKAQWISQTQSVNSDQYFDVHPGDTILVQAKFKNIGTRAWYQFFGSAAIKDDKSVTIAIYKDPKVKSSWSGKDDPKNPEYGTSEFFNYSLSENGEKIASIEENVVKSGEIGTFDIILTVPLDAPEGKYREDITLAAGPYWMEADKETADSIGAAHIWVGLNIKKESETLRKLQLVDFTTPYSIEYDSNVWNLERDINSSSTYFTLKSNAKCLIYLRSWGQFSSATESNTEDNKTLNNGKKVFLERLYTNKKLLGEIYQFDFDQPPRHPIFTIGFPDNVTESQKATMSKQAWEIVKTLSY